jgi:small subunit ribosomal protein S9
MNPTPKPKRTPVKRGATPKKSESVAVVAEPAKAAEAHVEERYWEAVGRRKSAIARVRLYTKGEHGFFVNGKPMADYFPYPQHQKAAGGAVATMNSEDRFRVNAKVSGGGVAAQAVAVRHATARALVLFNTDFRKRLKKAGFLTRDPRAKERRKFGLKKARKAPQWAKR